MELFKRRPASLSMLADREFRNYFIADVPFEFGAEVRRFAMSWMALTLFQTVVSNQMQGRVLSMYGVVTASFPLGFILGGALAALFGNEAAIVMGALVSTPVILVTYAMSPALRRV